MSDKSRKLNYRFHNPNTKEEITKFIINLLIDVHKPIVYENIQRNLAEKKDCS